MSDTDLPETLRMRAKRRALAPFVSFVGSCPYPHPQKVTAPLYTILVQTVANGSINRSRDVGASGVRAFARN